MWLTFVMIIGIATTAAVAVQIGELRKQVIQTQNKDAIRDMWMRAHQSELMSRIEERGKR